MCVCLVRFGRDISQDWSKNIEKEKKKKETQQNYAE